MNTPQPLLIVGLPRSGTTWVGEVLSTAKNTLYLFEPDNEKLSPLAWLCKSELHRFPYLTSQDSSHSYQRLWNTILNGKSWIWLANNVLGLSIRQKAFKVEAGIGNKCGYVYVDNSMHKVNKEQAQTYRIENRALRDWLLKQLSVNKTSGSQKHRRIIKSVHAPLSTDWIAGNFSLNVVFVLRNPYSLYSSYKRMKMPDGFRNLLFQESLQRDMLQYLPELKRYFVSEKDEHIAFQIMLMYKIIEQQLITHPEWTLISHDRLCMTPHAGYNLAFSSLGLEWSKFTDEKIDSLNETGGGFAPKRISSQEPVKWKKEISGLEQAYIQRWINNFDLNQFFKQHIDLE